MSTKVNMKKLQVRNIQPQEITEAFNLIQPSGWMHMTQNKLHILCTCYPQYFFVVVDESNELIGILNLYPTFHGQFVLGMVVVKESCRKQGVGSQMVRAVLSKFPRTGITLLSDPSAEQFYEKLGFKPAETLEICQIELDKSTIDEKSAQTKIPGSISFRTLKKDSQHEILMYLTKVRTYEDEHHVDVMTQYTTCFIARDDSCGQLVGTLCVLENDHGTITIDTFYADSEDIANALFIEVTKSFPDASEVNFIVNPEKRHLVQFGKLKASAVLTRLAKGRVNIPKQHKMFAASDPLCRI